MKVEDSSDGKMPFSMDENEVMGSYAQTAGNERFGKHDDGKMGAGKSLQ
jgi:hypothetical protein